MSTLVSNMSPTALGGTFSSNPNSFNVHDSYADLITGFNIILDTNASNPTISAGRIGAGLVSSAHWTGIQRGAYVFDIHQVLATDFIKSATLSLALSTGITHNLKIGGADLQVFIGACPNTQTLSATIADWQSLFTGGAWGHLNFAGWAGTGTYSIIPFDSTALHNVHADGNGMIGLATGLDPGGQPDWQSNTITAYTVYSATGNSQQTPPVLTIVHTPAITFSFDGANGGKLMNTDSDFEYSLDGGTSWTDCTTNTDLSPYISTVNWEYDIQVRLKIDPLQTQTINLHKGPSAPTDVVFYFKDVNA